MQIVVEVMAKVSRYQTAKSESKGFSLVELMIVLIITLSILATLGFRTSGAISNLEIGVVASEIALAVYQVKDEAIKGNADVQKRTFDLAKALARSHNGIIVTSTPIIGINNCSNGCDDAKVNATNSICVSENAFCFNSSQAFTFDKFSGRLANNHAIFITSDRRKIAILITTSGDHYVAELINNIWQTERDLQKLFPKENNSTK